MNFWDKVFAIVVAIVVVWIVILMPFYMVYLEHEEKIECIRLPGNLGLCKQLEKNNGEKSESR